MDRAQRVRCNGPDRWQVLRFPYSYHPRSWQCVSICQIEIMKQHDMFYLFSPWENFHKDFKLLGNDLVTHVWADDEQVVWCYDDKERCIQNELNPDGVCVDSVLYGLNPSDFLPRPPWKLFAFTFWGSKPLDSKWNSPSTPWSFNPLGSEWNLVYVFSPFLVILL